jgi:hypothetical protein
VTPPGEPNSRRLANASRRLYAENRPMNELARIGALALRSKNASKFIRETAKKAISHKMGVLLFLNDRTRKLTMVPVLDAKHNCRWYRAFLAGYMRRAYERGLADAKAGANK